MDSPDQEGLIEWVESMPEKLGKIKLVHGTYNSSSQLAEILRSKGYNAE